MVMKRASLLHSARPSSDSSLRVARDRGPLPRAERDRRRGKPCSRGRTRAGLRPLQARRAPSPASPFRPWA